MKTARQTSREATELWRWCQVNGALDEGRARQVVDRVLASDTTGWQAVLKRFQRLLKIEWDRQMATIESAAPLPADVRDALVHSLTSKYGPQLTTAFVVDPGLIAGVRIRVGNDVYDGSFKAGLAELEARL